MADKQSERVYTQINTDSVVAYGISDPGRVRKENEDSIFLDKGGSFVLLADGMGGMNAGPKPAVRPLKSSRNFLIRKQ